MKAGRLNFFQINIHFGGAIRPYNSLHLFLCCCEEKKFYPGKVLMRASEGNWKLKQMLCILSKRETISFYEEQLITFKFPYYMFTLYNCVRLRRYP